MMTRIDYRDIIGGGLLIALGIFSGTYAMSHYETGTLNLMGPGMLPASLGFILAGFGVAILAPALFRIGTLPKPDYRSSIAVLTGILAFALTIEAAGMVPAIFLMTVAAALADRKVGAFGTLALAAILSALAILVFRVALGISLYAFVWPFG